MSAEEEMRGLLFEWVTQPVEFEDPRMDWKTVQVERDLAARTAAFLGLPEGEE